MAYGAKTTNLDDLAEELGLTDEPYDQEKDAARG